MKIRARELIAMPTVMFFITLAAISVFLVTIRYNRGAGFLLVAVCGAISVIVIIYKYLSKLEKQGTDRPGMFDLTDFINLAIPFGLVALVLLFVTGGNLNALTDFFSQTGTWLLLLLVIVLIVILCIDAPKARSSKKTNEILKDYAQRHNLSFKPGNIRFFASKSIPAQASGRLKDEDISISVGFTPTTDRDGTKHDMGADRTIISMTADKAEEIIMVSSRRAKIIDGVPDIFDSHVNPILFTERVNMDQSFSRRYNVDTSSEKYAAEMLTPQLLEELDKYSFNLFIGQRKIVLGRYGRPKTLKDIEEKTNKAIDIAQELKARTRKVG